MIVRDVIDCLTEVAPLSLQESYDNAGIQVGDEGAEVHKILVALDVTEAVVDEAISKSCDLIVSHHPLIFKGLKRITTKSFIERIVTKALKNDIAIVSMHTNLDNSYLGISRGLAEHLGLKSLQVLHPAEGKLLKLVVYCPDAAADAVRKALFESGAGNIGNYDSCSFNSGGEGTFRAHEGCHPFVGQIGSVHVENELRIETVLPDYALDAAVAAMKKVHPYEEVAYDVFRLENDFDKAGSGMIGDLDNPMTEEAFLSHVSDAIGATVLRHSRLTGRMIRRVALCGGSGFFLLPDARRAHADAFLTADVKYHDFFEPDGGLLLIDGGHFETEQFAKEIFCDLIRKKITNFAAVSCETDTNAVHYFVKTK